MPYSKEEINHLAFVRRLREKNAVQYLADRDVYLTEWINHPRSRVGQENWAGRSGYGWKKDNGKFVPGQVLNMAPRTDVDGRMVYNLYQDIQTGNIQQGITFISLQESIHDGSRYHRPTGYDVELTVNFVETIRQRRDRFVPHSAVKVIDNRFKEVDYITSGNSDYTTITETTSDTTSGDTGSTSSTSSSGGGSGGTQYDNLDSTGIDT